MLDRLTKDKKYQWDIRISWTANLSAILAERRLGRAPSDSRDRVKWEWCAHHSGVLCVAMSWREMRRLFVSVNRP